jgi:hypothetical protein
MKKLFLTFFSLSNLTLPLIGGEVVTLSQQATTLPDSTDRTREATEALMTAVQAHDPVTALNALENGARSEEISLLFPAHTNDTEILKLLVAKRKSSPDALDYQDDAGRSALYLACFNGNAEGAEFLLNAGASPFLTVSKTDFFHTNRDTALNVACKKCPRSTVELLLQKGGHRLVNTTNEHGRSCLHDVCKEQNINTDTLALLLEHGGDANLRDNEGNTPFHYACGAKSNKATQKEALALLMRHGADTTILNNKGRTGRVAGLFLDITNHRVLDGLSQEALNLQREAKKAAQALAAATQAVEKQAKQVVCSICMGEDETQDPHKHTTIACNHTYDRDCLAAWIAAQQARHLPASCPLCRSTDLTEKK